jgi:hypothetical protein
MPKQIAAAFISYCRVDQEFALRLAQDLKAAGATVWLDQLDIKPGHPWDNAVEGALRAATKMLVILTPTSVSSENVRDEIAYALKQGKIVIPVLYMECEIPLRLERKQRIDFRANYARGLDLLLHELRVDNPNVAVLEKAAEGDAQRHLAWQAREAEAKRLEALQQPPSARPAPPPAEANVTAAIPVQPSPQASLKGRSLWVALAATAAALILVIILHYKSPSAPTEMQPPQTAVIQPKAEPSSGQGNRSVPTVDSDPEKPTPPEALLTWTDPATGLTWTKNDSRKEFTLEVATAYCQNLRLAGHRDWRLPTIDELWSIHDSSINAPGQRHVKGGLNLSGESEFSSSEQGPGEAYYLVFDALGGSGAQAGAPANGVLPVLCVRGHGG